jgi:hypothetical protein
MADTFQSVLIGGISGAVSAVITYLSTRSKIRLELSAEYDKELRTSRLDAYKKLWEILEPLARYGSTEPLSYEVLQLLSAQTRSWYFKSGGIYLTRASRRPYFEWKKVMQPVLDDVQHRNNPKAGLPAAITSPILSAASLLRTSLSDDIRTKERSLL